MLTGKQIYEQEIVKNIASSKQIQQQGIDLTLKNIYKVTGQGSITKDKTIPPTYELIPESSTYELEPGWYRIDFNEGCCFPDNAAGLIKGRSSVLRCGGHLESGLYDAGFACDTIGAFLHVCRPMTIEHGARLGQMVVETSDKVDNTYKGQWNW